MVESAHVAWSARAATQVDVRWSVILALTGTHGALDQPNPLSQFALDSIDPGLGALLILIGRAAADADPTGLHIVCGHNWKTPGKRNDAGKIGYARHDSRLALLAEGELTEPARREGKVC